jgi:CHAT domain-containing protein
MPISASARQSVPPSPAPDAQVEKLLREGEAALDLDRLDQAQELLTQALAAHEALGRPEVRAARIITRLGQVARAREELDQAQAHHDCAFLLLQVVGPDTVEMAHVLNNMGSVARRRDELDRAEEYFQRSLALQEKHDPHGLDVAQVLNNLGALAHSRTDLVAADRYLRRAFAIKEKVAPDSLTLAATLNNMAMVAMYREDMASAEAYARRAVAIKERLAPDSLTLASGLTNLAGPVRRRGNTSEAEALVRRGLVIRERLAPESLAVSDSLHQLALLARERGDLEQVESLMHRTLALEKRVVPGGLRMALTLRRLAEVALARRRWDDAERHLAPALAIWERLQPDSFGEGRTRHLRALLLRERGRLPEAADELRRAVDALESQIGTLGGLNEDRSTSRAQRGRFYADLVDVLVQLQQAPEAFHVLERSRARGFLEMLTTRDLAPAERAPAALEAERRRLAWQHDRRQQRLAEEGRTSSAAAARLQDELRDLRRRHSELVEQFRRQGAGASLRYPQPFDLAQTTAALEPGTLLLSYAVGDERTHVFAVSREDGLTVQTLSSGHEALTKEVELFRRLIQEAAPASPRVSQLAEVGGRLYQTLIAPLASRVERCRRVVIVPDGPLHLLPFAALVREQGRAPGQRVRYLIEWKPLSTALSATVYGELRQRPAVGEAGPGRAAPTLVAFGDPALPAGAAADGEASDQERSLLKEVTALRPLPAARQEVDRIAALFAGSAVAWVGPRATEERVKGLPPRVRYVHFATHAVLDHVSPMDTTLVLAAPEGAGGGGENGLLQAWEILEQLRLEADLVVLSACDSGLGRELRGEGLLSLTRAFQHAGARSVMASLWRVGDPLTAALMVRFYRHLKQGAAKDEALRAAQMELIAGPVAVTDRAGRARDRDASLPYHWAAFQLHGDGQ